MRPPNGCSQLIIAAFFYNNAEGCTTAQACISLFWLTIIFVCTLLFVTHSAHGNVINFSFIFEPQARVAVNSHGCYRINLFNSQFNSRRIIGQELEQKEMPFDYRRYYIRQDTILNDYRLTISWEKEKGATLVLVTPLPLAFLSDLNEFSSRQQWMKFVSKIRFSKVKQKFSHAFLFHILSNRSTHVINFCRNDVSMMIPRFKYLEILNK